MRATTVLYPAGLLSLVLLGGGATAGARPGDKKVIAFTGADGQGRLCLQTPKGDGPQWRLVALAFTGKELAGEEVKACRRKLARGLPKGAVLLLRAKKPKGQVEIPVPSSEEEVAVSSLPTDRKERWYQQAARLLRRGRGLSLQARHGRRRVTVASLRNHPEGVQYIRIRVQHDPESQAVAYDSYTFYGRGLSVGPSQRHHAVFSPATGKGRIVREQYIAEDCPDPKRCGSKPPSGLKDFFKSKPKKK